MFNELNAAFRDRWLQIVPVDLRWGVSQDETSVIQQTCLNEIVRAERGCVCQWMCVYLLVILSAPL